MSTIATFINIFPLDMCKTSYEEQWKRINWQQALKFVSKAQSKIYKASKENNKKLVIETQKSLVRSWYARLLTIRNIVQENRSYVDISDITNLTYKNKIEFANTLVLDGINTTLIEPYIDKNKIITLQNRAKQYLLLLALEPEWESRFEPNNYGFRPGRSIHDVVFKLSKTLKKEVSYLSFNKIRSCFSRISHTWLLETLNTCPLFRLEVKKWLKLGVIVEEKKERIEIRRLQQNPISPLFINILLHYLDQNIKPYLSNNTTYKTDSKVSLETCEYIRYGNQFVLICSNIKTLNEVLKVVGISVCKVGLEINNSESSITHSLNENIKNKSGVSFLGFHIRHVKKAGGKLKKVWTLSVESTPERTYVQNHINQLRDIVKSHETKSQINLIEKINPICIRWSQYYRFSSNKQTYKQLDHIMVNRLLKWGYNRHPTKSKGWVKNKYFYNIDNRNWYFGVINLKTRVSIYSFVYSKRVKESYLPIDNTKSPYDGNNNYWLLRLKQQIL